MWQPKKCPIAAVCAAALWLAAQGVSAQVNPELGDTSASGQVTTTQTTTTTTESSSPPADDVGYDGPNRFSGTDHGSVVGRFGVGFFGVVGVPTPAFDGDGDLTGELATASAPTLGIRYWLQDALAIEAALGFAITSSGTSSESDAGGEAEANGPSNFALALHGGVPLVFAASKHFAFEVIPELNIGFATGGVDDESPANEDIDTSGFLLELGARVGAEIQFGFIDIPELALQATVGVHLRLENRSVSQGDVDTTNSRFSFGTDLQGEPWDIFQGAVATIYYF